jgi:hypothetical protein
LCAVTPHLSGSFCDGNRILHSHLTQVTKPIDLSVFSTFEQNHTNNSHSGHNNTSTVVGSQNGTQSNSLGMGSYQFDTIFNSMTIGSASNNYNTNHNSNNINTNKLTVGSTSNTLGLHRTTSSLMDINSKNQFISQIGTNSSNVLDTLNQQSLVNTFTNPRSNVQQPHNGNSVQNSHIANSTTNIKSNFASIAGVPNLHGNNDQSSPLSSTENPTTPDFTNLVIGSSTLPPIQLTTAFSSHHTPRKDLHHSNSHQIGQNGVKTPNIVNNNNQQSNNNNHDGNNDELHNIGSADSLHHDFSMLVDKTNAASVLTRSYRAQNQFNTHNHNATSMHNSSRVTTFQNGNVNNPNHPNNQQNDENGGFFSSLLPSASGLFNSFSFSKQSNLSNSNNTLQNSNSTKNSNNNQPQHSSRFDFSSSSTLSISSQQSNIGSAVPISINGDNNQQPLDVPTNQYLDNDDITFQHIDANTGLLVSVTQNNNNNNNSRANGEYAHFDQISPIVKKLPNGEKPSGLSTSMSILNQPRHHNDDNNNEQEQNTTKTTTNINNNNPTTTTENSISPDDLLFFYIQNHNLHTFQKTTQIVTTLFTLLKELEQECTASLSVHYSLYSTSLQWKILYYRIMTINHWCNILYTCDLTEDLIL